jgi:hypothetical protein
MNLTGLCLCGCGLPTTISRCNDTRRGWVKGQPRDYRHGHASRRQWHKERIAVPFEHGREVRRERRRRTQKLGPYKAGRAVHIKSVIDKIEAALKQRRAS